MRKPFTSGDLNEWELGSVLRAHWNSSWRRHSEATLRRLPMAKNRRPASEKSARPTGRRAGRTDDTRESGVTAHGSMSAGAVRSFPNAALTIATMPARIASRSRSHASMTAERSEVWRATETSKGTANDSASMFVQTLVQTADRGDLTFDSASVCEASPLGSPSRR